MSQLGNCSGGTDAERYGPSRLAVRYESIVALRLDPQNPRLHSRKQVRQIAHSIKSFGFNVPVLIDAEQSVIAGHGRVLAAKALGWTEVPVIAIEHLDAAQRRAFAIADNRLTENSTWDDRLLADQLKGLSILDLSFDLEATGFDMGEIDFRIESLEEKPEAPDPADQLPSLQERAVGRVGDLWRQLKPGSLVFAAGFDEQDNLDGWWEAIIVRIDDGEFLVRWRDEPDQPRASRSREFIALLHPRLTGL
jgi:ParB-like nuclease domain